MSFKEIGRNRFYNPKSLTEVPEIIFQSNSDGFYLVFEKNVSNDIVLKAFSFFNKKNIIDVINSTYLDKSPHLDLGLEDVLYFKEIDVAYTRLHKNQIELINKKDRHFKVQVDGRLIRFKAENNYFLERVIPVNWGIQRMKITSAVPTGKGVNVAILDTGIQEDHPQLINREITTQYFVGNSARDNDGHGTFCSGILAGNIDSLGVRYGVANECSLYVGRIMTSGMGKQINVLKGICWAIKNKCRVISLSYEEENYGTNLNYNLVYDRMFEFCLSQNCAVIVPAGNGSNRPESYARISIPGNCNNAITVGAIDYDDLIYEHSNRAAKNQEIDYVAPGKKIYSCTLQMYQSDDENGFDEGTSMSVPFVAGIVALLCDKYPKKNIHEILAIMKSLPKDNSEFWKKEDVGEGLIIAEF